MLASWPVSMTLKASGGSAGGSDTQHLIRNGTLTKLSAGNDVFDIITHIGISEIYESR